jgi:transglutaminase-like putative cysteine protease
LDERLVRPSALIQLLTCALAVLMVASVIFSLSSFWRLDLGGPGVWLISLAAAGGGWLFWRAPRWSATGAAAALVAFLGWVRYDKALRSYIGLVYEQWREFYLQMSNYQWDATFGEDLGIFFSWAVAMPLGALVVRESLRRGSLFWSVAAGATIFGIQWGWYYEPAAEYFTWFTVAGFLLWAVSVTGRLDAQWAATRRKVLYRSRFYTAAAWVLVATVVASTFPINWEPVDLGRIADRINEAFPALRHMRGAGSDLTGGRFNLKMTGLTASLTELGGRALIDDTLVFHMVTDDPLLGTAYLRGNTATVYTGRGWSGTRAQATPFPPSGAFPTVYSSQVPRTYVTIRIEPLVPIGASVFTMMEPARVDGLKSLYLDTDGNVWSDKVLTRNQPYTVDIRWIRYNRSQIRALSLAPGPASQPYLQLPETVPDRVRSLANQITWRELTPIDKALAIERFLQQIPYTLSVPATPRDRDLVDYFLFDLGKGYCVYHATAMVVMLRLLGIPARWVQGYAIPPNGEQKVRDGKPVYLVRNSQAHAWVEAYFPGYGWVTFEPSARPDLVPIERDFVLADAQQSLAALDPAAMLSLLDDTDILRDEWEFFGGGTAGWRMPRWVLPVLGALLAVWLVWWLLQRRLKKQEEIRSTIPAEVVQEAWERAVWLMGRFGLRRRSHQTAHEFADEVGGALPPLLYPAHRAAAAYDAARYGPADREGSPADADETRKFWEKADEELFEQNGWARYLWRRLTWW